MAKKVKPQKKQGTMDVVGNSLNEGWKLIQEKWKWMFKKFLTATLIPLVPLVLVIIIAALIGYFSNQWWIAVVIGLLSMYLVMIFAKLLETTLYNIADSASKNQDIGILGQAKSNFIPWVKISIFWIVYYAIIFSPLILLYGAIFGTFIASIGGIASDPENINPVTTFAPFYLLMGSYFLMYLWIIIVSIISIIVRFLIQFVGFELYISKLGLRESFKKSFSLVKNNFLETLIFDIVIVVLMYVATMVIYIPLLIGFVGIFISFALPEILMYLVLALSIVFLIITLMVLTVLIEVAAMSFKYVFWKKIRER